MYDDTIAAIATPLGAAGIGIVRVSGPEAISLVDGIFKGHQRDSILNSDTYQAHYGHIIDPVDGRIVDETICLVMRGPKSYTREDVVEIDSHGGTLPLKQILELLLSQGARLAEPGEFTRRAFLNGRIDLAQAEAVMDIVNARTEEGMELALRNLEGGLSKKVRALRQNIIELLSHLEASIDFPDDEIPEFERDELEGRLLAVLEEIKALISSSRGGRIYREGIETTIIGRPNVGKSSLLNALLGEKRAIVTEIPGTTRDTIEEIVNIRGIPLKIADTAGIRDTRDLIEREGVDRSMNLLSRSDLVLLVIDVNQGLTEDDLAIIKDLSHQKLIVVVNKMDLEARISQEEIEDLFPGQNIIWTSMLREEGLEQLKDRIVEMVMEGEVVDTGRDVVANMRQLEALKNAFKGTKRALETQQQGLPVDFITIDLRDAGESLGRITGETLQEDIIDQIFSEFCLGK